MAEEESNYSIMVTYKCNWHCNYCITNTHEQPDISFYELKKKVDSIPPNERVSLSGGEPALLDKDSMYYAFYTLRDKGCIINVNTNGLFFEKYPELVPQCDNIYYHSTENLDKEKGIKLYDSIDYDKTDFMMVVTDKNMQNLEWFLDEYPDILFKIQGASESMVMGKMGDKLSKINGIRIYQKYKDRIHPESYIFLLEECRTVKNKMERV